MTHFTIHPATYEDLSEITALNHHDLGYPEATLITAIDCYNRISSDPNHIILVAKLDQAIIGYVHAEVYITLYAPPCVNILGIAVKNTVRGHGIGKALLENIEAWAKSSGYHGVRLNSNTLRTDAHMFYEHCGYHSSKTQKHFYKII